MAEVDVAGTGGKPKKLNMVVGGERYRTGASYLIADDGATTYLFRALNSKYFVQRQGETDTIDVLPPAEAERIYNELPHKHQSLVAAFPKTHGGVGMNTPSAYDDDDERERLARDYEVDTTKAYDGLEGHPFGIRPK